MLDCCDKLRLVKVVLVCHVDILEKALQHLFIALDVQTTAQHGILELCEANLGLLELVSSDSLFENLVEGLWNASTSEGRLSKQLVHKLLQWLGHGSILGLEDRIWLGSDLLRFESIAVRRDDVLENELVGDGVVLKSFLLLVHLTEASQLDLSQLVVKHLFELP